MVARTLKVMHIKGRQLDQAKIPFNCIPFQSGTSLKGKNLLPEVANSFLYEQFLIVLKIITLSDLPWMLLFLLCMCVTCVMGTTPMKWLCSKFSFDTFNRVLSTLLLSTKKNVYCYKAHTLYTVQGLQNWIDQVKYFSLFFFLIQ